MNTNETHPAPDLLEKLLSNAGIGWWQFDFDANIFYWSQTAAQLMDTDRLSFPFGDFPASIHEEHRTRLIAKIAAMKVSERFDETFSATVRGRLVWLRATLIEIRQDLQTNRSIAYGSIRRLTRNDISRDDLAMLGERYDMAMLANRQIDLLIHNLPIGYMRLNLLRNKQGEAIDYLFAYMNRTSENMLGISQGERIGRTARELGILNETELRKMSGLKAEEYFEQTWVIDSNHKHCHCITYNTPGDNDEMVVLIEDRTDSVNANNLLRSRHEFLTNIFQSISVGIELYNTQGRLTDINAKDLEMFGIEKAEDVLGIDLFSNPNIPAEVMADIHAEKEVDFVGTYDFGNIRNYYTNTRQGTMDWTGRVRYLYDNNGELTNILLINIDDSELKRSRTRLADFESMFSMVSDFARVGFANLNLLTGEGYSQGIWRQNYGENENTPLTQIIGHYDHVLLEDRERLKAELNEIIAGRKRSGSAIVRILPESGHIRWTKANFFCRNYRPEENVIELVSINYDITALKRTETELIAAKERAEESNKLKSAFMANMSHEIRTPLNAIVGFSELLADEEDPDTRKEYTDTIRSNNDLLLQIISDVLDLARIESGRLEIEREEIDVRALCGEIVEMLRLQRHPGVELKVEEGLPECRIREYRQGLIQVLGNFTRNALKFTHEGSVTLGFEHMHKLLRIYVRDTGIGIAPEAQKRIFERFVKLDTFTQGTGLGLSICTSIADRIGGSIGVESKPGQGSCFHIDIPTKE